jgi:hypothetical protein
VIIHTYEELKALPLLSVVIDDTEMAYQKDCPEDWSSWGRYWITTQIDLPVRVLHLGGSAVQL